MTVSLLLVEVVFSWGHMVKPPFISGGARTLPYPPPTTLIGALAHPYLKLVEPVETIYIGGKPYSPAVKLLGKVKYAILGYVEGLAVDMVDIGKYYTYAYIRQKYKEDEKYWSSAVGVGKTYSPTKAVITYIVERNEADKLGKTAWGIHRIGSKEGLVAVRNVEVIREPVVTYKNSIIETIFPTPADIVEPVEDYTYTYFWKIDERVYTSWSEPRVEDILTKYYVPLINQKIYGGTMKVKPRDNASIIETRYGFLIVPKQVLGGQ